MTTNLTAIVPLLPLALQEQVPHYEETSQPNLYAAMGISLLLGCVCVGLRLYGRRLQGLNLWWDDYLSLVALFFTAVSVATFVSLVQLGFGRHEIVLVLEHSDHIGTFLRLLIASDALYFPAICFARLAILFQYRRLFPAKKFKWVLVAVGVASAVYCILSVILITVLCLPIKIPSLDRPLDHPLSCSNIKDMIYWMGSFGVALDFIILLLPMPYVWRLNTTFRRKLQLTGVFLLGVFVVVISILRTWYISLMVTEDFTWTACTGFMWSEVEACLAIVAGCLPAMTPLFRGRGFGRKKATYQPAKNVNLVTFGSGGKKNNPGGISFTIETSVTATGTTQGNGNYTEITNEAVGQESQAKYHREGGRWPDQI